MPKKLSVFMLVLLLGAGFFCVQKVWASQNILISEVQITGGTGKTENDFIEIYNPNNFQVNLKGYRLVKRTKTGTADTGIKSWTADIFIPANSYYLWVNSGYVDIPTTPDITTTATISNDNGVAIRFGAADTGTIIDSVAWGGAQNAFIEGTAFPTNPGVNQSLERKLNLDTNNNSTDFFIQENPNPQNSSAAATSSPPAEPPVIPVMPTSPTATSSSVSLRYKLGDVVINEFVADPTDNEVEWIEIYNMIDGEADLSGWTIEDGSKTKTNLTGRLGREGDSRFKIIDKPAGVLNNSGDIIILRDGQGNLIDQVTYGNWDDGNIGNNAPKASDPDSVARKSDGYNSYNNLNDFALTTTPTKGKSNIITLASEEEEISAEQQALYDYSSDIFISEILPNPVGDDGPGEFIELFNNGAKEVNLAGWSVADASGLKHKISTTSAAVIIKAGEYLALYRSQTKIALNNDRDSVRLFQPFLEKPCQTVKYEQAIEGSSYNLVNNPPNPLYQGGSINDDWVWSETITPGKANIIKTVNHPPAVEFNYPALILVGQPVIFDSSDTFDQDGDELKFSWDFGDGVKLNLPSPEHTFIKAGSYIVVLSVSDGQNEVKQEKIVKVPSDSLNLESLASGQTATITPVMINELLPSPIGNDATDEWIELYNPANSAVNLLNWQLDDEEGGSAPDKFLQDLWLGGNDYLVVKRIDSGLALNNTGDAVRLFTNLAELVDEVEYQAAVEGEAYARGENGKWFWTSVLTPGEKNIISVADSQSGDLVLAGNLGKQQAAEIVETTLEKIAEYEVGALLKVKGVVAVLPGVLGAQFFYIVGSPGLQIYNYKKEFPKLKVGDYIEVSGELGLINGEKRLKTKNLADIKILEQRSEPIAEQLSCDKISEDYVGRLIAVSGEVTDRKGSTVYLDDGNDEAIVYLKQATGIKPSSLTEGKSYRITGILGKTNSGLRIMPRSEEDIVLVNQVAEVGSVLGEVAASDEWAVAERNKKLELFKYLLIIAAGAIIILGGLLIRAVRK